MGQTIILFDYCHDAWREKLFLTGRWGYIIAAQFVAIIIVSSKRCVAVPDRGSGTGLHGTGTV